MEKKLAGETGGWGGGRGGTGADSAALLFYSVPEFKKKEEKKR